MPASASPSSSLADEDCDPAEALAVASVADDVEQIEEIVNDIIHCEDKEAVGSLKYYTCIKESLEANNFENAKLMLSVPKIFSNIYSGLIEDLKKFKLEDAFWFNKGFKGIRKSKEIYSLLIKQLQDKTINIVQRILYLDFLEMVYNKNLSSTRTALASHLKGYTIEPESLEKSVHFYVSFCDNTDDKPGKKFKQCTAAAKDIAMNVNTPPPPVITSKTASDSGRGLSSFNKPNREWPKPFDFQP